MIAYRIVLTEYAQTAMTGKGAKEYGGRWNSKGRSMVYLAQTLSLATLEILVHLPDYGLLSRSYSYIKVEFDASAVHVLDLSLLPPNWKKPELPALKKLGDDWLDNTVSPVLQVPSALLPTECNFLINPAHIETKKIIYSEPSRMIFDQRLLKA